MNDIDTDPDLLQRIQSGSGRIERIEHQGRTLWVKRPETLSLRMRLQKGNPKLAFGKEVAAHRTMFDLGLPVAPVVAASSDYLVTEDCGPSLLAVLRQDRPEAFEAGLAAAGGELARIHAAGMSHGRPSLKDICWHDGAIAFLDFERAGREGNLAKAQSMDAMILIFSTAVETSGSKKAMTIARDAYIAAGGNDVWHLACNRARRWRLLQLPLWPVVRLLPKNKEFAAIAPFFRFMC